MPSFKHFINIYYKIYDEKPNSVGHLELPNDANLASSRFQIRIPIPTYFCKNIFCRRYCRIILGSCQTNNNDIGFYRNFMVNGTKLFQA